MPDCNDPRSRQDDDWYAQSVRAHSTRECERIASPMSSAWGRGRMTGDVVQDMRMIRDVSRNLARTHGLPKECRVDLAAIGDIGAGLAGFEDAPSSFTRPYILLDKEPYESCDPADVLNVYGGIVLHETGHVQHTRDFYVRLSHGLSGDRRVYENLLEDERIEELVRRESPGFAPYIQAAKRAILEEKEPGQVGLQWDTLPDLDKVHSLIFDFIRCPHLITDEMQRWTTISGECVFTTLRASFPAGPATEADVVRYADVLMDLVKRLQGLYAKDDPPPVGDTNGGAGTSGGAAVPGGPDERAARRHRQRIADGEDHALSGATSLEECVERLVREAVAREQVRASVEAEGLLQLAIDLENAGDAVTARAGRRFSLPEINRVLDRCATVRRPLDPNEVRELQQMERERVSEGDSWDWETQRRTVITHPIPDDENRRAYAAARQTVRAQVAAMRAVFSQRLGRRTCQTRELTQGQLDRRRLGRAGFTDRIFRRVDERTERGLALCVLLDASGSMAAGTPPRSVAALEVAVLVAESLRGLPAVELEMYSHTSCADKATDCLVQYLYGRSNPDVAAIGSYRPGRMNYDHQAILTAATLFRANTKNSNRLMLVVSDGMPNGIMYRGASAVQVTRDAVESVRGRGIQVLNVAIADFHSEAIFGRGHVAKFTDLGRLVQDMRRLLTEIVRKATAG